MNRIVSGRWLEEVVWQFISKVLLDPVNLRQGYADNLAQQQTLKERHQARISFIQKELAKLQQKLDALTDAFIDPSIPITKEEYLRKRGPIDYQIKTLEIDKQTLEDELEGLTLPADLEAMEQFANKVLVYLNNKTDVPFVEKRRILEMLHALVIIEPEGQVRVEGWFNPPSVATADGETSTASTRCARPLPRLQARA
jgi:hypothetical protein